MIEPPVNPPVTFETLQREVDRIRANARKTVHIQDILNLTPGAILSHQADIAYILRSGQEEAHD